jgi:hypothetical protein
MPTPSINLENINIAVQSGVYSWDLAVNYNFGIILGQPIGQAFGNSGGFTPSGLSSSGDYPAVAFQNCLVFGGTNGPMFSDGSNWKQVPICGGTVAAGSGWSDTYAMSVFNAYLTYMQATYYIAGYSGPGVPLGTRPAYWSTLVNGQQSWDARVQDNFNLCFNKPFPLAAYAQASLPSASTYSNCCLINSTKRCVCWSDGTNWNPVPTGFTTLAGLGSAWFDTTAQADFDNLIAVLAAATSGLGGGSLVRPTPSVVASGLQNWDVIMSDNFSLAWLFPMAVYANTLANINSLVSGGGYDLCLSYATDIDRPVIGSSSGPGFGLAGYSGVMPVMGASVPAATGWVDTTAMAQFNALVSALQASGAIT